MQPIDQLRLLTFLVIFGTVYVLASSILVRRVLAKFGTLETGPRKNRWLQRLILVLAAAGLICMAYGYFVEPYWPSITRVEIRSEKVAAASSPIRLVHISDMHSDPIPRLETRLPELIASEKPDLILFTGDSINSPEGLPVFKECLTGIAKIAPTYVVKGNWDTAFWGAVDLFGETGAHELNGDTASINIRGSTVWLAGVASGYEERIPPALSQLQTDAFTIFLHHYPDLIHEIAALGVDLYCAGHTHGGQVALPFYGALITFSKFGKQFEAGLFRVGETSLYVNRGIGLEGGFAPRVRFLARPEITVIDVSGRK